VSICVDSIGICIRDGVFLVLAFCYHCLLFACVYVVHVSCRIVSYRVVVWCCVFCCFFYDICVLCVCDVFVCVRVCCDVLCCAVMCCAESIVQRRRESKDYRALMVSDSAATCVWYFCASCGVVLCRFALTALAFALGMVYF
jgi:hypothetical protein